MKRKHLVPALVLALLLALVCAVSAQAAEDPLKVSMALSNNTFSGPAEITVSISVTNVGESDMPGPVTLYYPSGKQVEEFGSPVLTVGTPKSWTGTWKVTQQELEAGRITFKLKYSLYNDAGELVNKTKNFSKKISYSGAAPELTVNRVIRPTTAQQGQEVTVTYEIENTGTSDVTAVTIKENSSISTKSGTIASIPVGGKESYTFTATMKKKNLTSEATISYKAGNKNYTQKVEAATVKYGVVNLTASAETDKKGGAPGDTVKLTVTLKNTGTVDFSGVKVTDDTLGEVFTDVSVPAKETVTLEKDITITESQDIQLTVTAQDDSGEPVETATGKISIVATDPTKQVVLSVDAKADRETVYEIPGSVRFTITVNNESMVDVSKITVNAVNTTINSISTIPAGGSVSFTREMAVSMAGTYQFTASCKDQLGQTVSFASNAIRIDYARPTEEPTEAPIVTPPAPQYQDVPQSYDELDASKKLPEWTDQVEGFADTAKWIFGGLAVLLLILLCIGFIRRGISKSHSNKAMDHLDGSYYRDYSTEPKKGKRSEISNGSEGKIEDPDENEAPRVSAESKVSSETLQRLYQDAEPKADEAQAGSGAADAPTADAPTADAPTADAPTVEAPAAVAPENQDGVHRRRSK